MKFPKDLRFDVGLGDILWGLLTWHVEWTDIKYDNAIWDFLDIKLSLTRTHDTSLVKVDFPAIKSWEISAN
jgi:hypothetical protein